MSVPNPHNGYVPKVGETVKVVGACHPNLLGQMVGVIAVEEGWADVKYLDSLGWVYTGVDLGGLESVQGGIWILPLKKNP